MKAIKRKYHRFLRFVNRLRYGKPVLVLMYHRIDNQSDKHLSKLTVSKENFEKQLDFFTNKYNCLRLEDDWNFTKKAGLAITFDDGYAHTLLDALPLLEKYQMPATLFITTEQLNKKDEFWWDRLAADYNACNEAFFLPDENVKVSKTDYSYAKICDFLATFKNQERYNWLSAFEKQNGLSFQNRENYRVLTFDELDRLAKHPLISIGLHTHRHPFLGKMSYEAQKEELQLSVNQLKIRINTYSNYLAVPYGSFNNDTFKLSDELGISGILLANNNYSNKANKKSGKINRIIMTDLKDRELKDYLELFD